jgi:hypothetical protein
MLENRRLIFSGRFENSSKLNSIAECRAESCKTAGSQFLSGT